MIDFIVAVGYGITIGLSGGGYLVHRVLMSVKPLPPEHYERALARFVAAHPRPFDWAVD